MLQMKKHLLYLSSLVLLFLPLAVFSEEKLCNIAKEALHDAVRIRGLEQKEPVPCKLQNKEEVKGYLLKVIDEKIAPERLEAEEFIYKVLGLVPENFNYKEGLVDLYISQLGGYYDPEANHFVMAQWLPAMMQNTIAVHELTHALQDQHFNLDTFLDHEGRTSDELLARSAVVEGDATAVMTDYTRSLIGQPALKDEDNVNAMMLQSVLGASLVGSSAGVPESLSLMIVFPYTSGLRFAHYMLHEKKSYSALDEYLKNPPKTTEEILHPELVLEGKGGAIEISEEELRGDDTGEKWKMTFDDSLGEFLLSILLAVQTDDRAGAANTAAGWGGDRVAIFEHEDTQARRLIWYTAWDSKKDAGEFYEMLQRVLKKRFKSSDHKDHQWKSDRLSYRVLNKGDEIVLYADEILQKS